MKRKIKGERDVDFSQINERIKGLQSTCRQLDEEIWMHSQQVVDARQGIEKLESQIQYLRDREKQAELEIFRKAKHHHEIFEDVLRYRRIYAKYFTKAGNILAPSQVKDLEFKKQHA